MIAHTCIQKTRKAKGKEKEKEKGKEKEKKKVKEKEKKKEKTSPARATNGLVRLITSTDGQKIKEVKAPKAKVKETKKEKAKEKATVKARVKAKRGEVKDDNPQLVHRNAIIGIQILASLAITALMIIHQTAKIGSTDGVSGTKNADLDTNKV